MNRQSRQICRPRLSDQSLHCLLLCLHRFDTLLHGKTKLLIFFLLFVVHVYYYFFLYSNAMPPLLFNKFFAFDFMDRISDVHVQNIFVFHYYLYINFSNVSFVVCHSIFIHWHTFDKTNKVASAPSEDSDQPGHPPSLIGVFTVRSMGSWGPKLSSCGQLRLWSDWANALADLSLRWAHMPLCWLCHETAQFYLYCTLIQWPFLCSSQYNFVTPFELAHTNTNKMTWVPSRDSDQSGHLPSLISLCTSRMKKHWVLSYP